jgi:hypothetical protein
VKTLRFKKSGFTLIASQSAIDIFVTFLLPLHIHLGLLGSFLILKQNK